MNQTEKKKTHKIQGVHIISFNFFKSNNQGWSKIGSYDGHLGCKFYTSTWVGHGRPNDVSLVRHPCWVCCKVFPEENGIRVGELREADCPPQCGSVLPNPLRAWIAGEDTGRLNLLSVWLTKLWQSSALSTPSQVFMPGLSGLWTMPLRFGSSVETWLLQSHTFPREACVWWLVKVRQ